MQTRTIGSTLANGVALPALIIAIAAATVTANALSNPFILDDTSKIVHNADIRHLSNIPSKLIYPYQANQVLERNNPSRPLAFLLYTLTYAVAGPSPIAFHLVNLLAHILAAILVFLLTRLVLQRIDAHVPNAPLIVALLFAVTPIQIGTVIYAYSLSDILSGALILLALYAFEKNETPSPRARAVSAAAMVLALLTKQTAVIIPFVIGAFDLVLTSALDWRRFKSRARLYLPFAAILALYFVYRAVYFGIAGAFGELEGAGNTHAPLDYALSQPAVIWKYFAMTLWPRGLAIDHYIVPTSFSVLEKGVALGALALFIVPVAMLWKRRTPIARVALFAIAFYFLSIGPTSSFFPTVDLLVERRVFQANWAIFFLVALVYDRLGKMALFRGSLQWLPTAFVTVHLLALASVSIARNASFETNQRAWENVLAIYPDSPRALNNLANTLMEKREYSQAKAIFERLIEKLPGDYIAMGNLGSLLEKEETPFHNSDKAREWFIKAIQIKPDYAPAYYNLGRLNQKQKDLTAAEPYYLKALELNPNTPLAHNNLGLIYFHRGRPDDARRRYEMALTLDPNCAPAKNNLRLLADGVPPPHAAGAPGDISPDAPQAAGRHEIPVSDVPADVIVKVYEEALRKDPANHVVRKKFAELCAARRLPCAQREYERLVRDNPNDAESRRALEALR